MNYGRFKLNERKDIKHLTCGKFVHSTLASRVVWGRDMPFPVKHLLIASAGEETAKYRLSCLHSDVFFCDTRWFSNSYVGGTPCD
jgi:hypothetical protein